MNVFDPNGEAVCPHTATCRELRRKADGWGQPSLPKRDRFLRWGTLLVAMSGMCVASAVEPLSEEMTVQAEKVLARQCPFEEQADVVYGTVDGFELKGDLYLPETGDGKRPGILVIHGGGWAGGDKSKFKKSAEKYAHMGFVVFNINYRLSGDAVAPAAVEDAKAALWFMADHDDEWKMDTSRMVTTGGSAGSHLALMAALCDDEAFGEPIEVAAVLNRSGVTDVYDLTYGDNPRVWAQKWLPPETPNGEELARRLSPISYVSRETLPPVFTLHGAEDDIVPVEQAMRLHLALKENGHSSELYLIPFCGHGFGSKLKRFNEIYDGLSNEMDMQIAAFFIRSGVFKDN